MTYYVSIGAHNFYTHGTLPEQYAQYSDNFNPHVTFKMTQLYKREVMDITTDGAYMRIWQIFQAANILTLPLLTRLAPLKLLIILYINICKITFFSFHSICIYM